MKKQSAKLRRHPRVLVVSAFLILLSIVTMYYGARLRQEVYAKETTGIEYKIIWKNQKIAGIYEGELSNSKPSGVGSFTSADQNLTYDGEWNRGKFDGKGTIHYEDGTWEIGEYSQGKRNGVCKLYSSDANYVEQYYNKGVPFGITSTYENDTITGTDYYVNSVLVSKVCETANLLSFDNLSKTASGNGYVTIEGVVAFIGQDEENCYFRIDTDSIGMVIGSYKNSIGQKNQQAYMPSMEVGDLVQIYGYCIGKKKNNFIEDVEGYQYEYPYFDPVYGVNLSEQDHKTDPDSYAFLLKNPYARYGERITDSFTVLKIKRKGKKYYIQATRKETAPKANLFTLTYKSDVDTFFYTGQVLTVSGYYNGQYKYMRNDELSHFNENSRLGVANAIYTYSYDVTPAIQIMEIQ